MSISDKCAYFQPASGQLEPGANTCIFKKSTHYNLPDRVYLRQKPVQNTVEEWSEHKNKCHFLNRHPGKLLSRLLVWSYQRILSFWIFNFFVVICLIGGDNSWVMYAHGWSSNDSTFINLTSVDCMNSSN